MEEAYKIIENVFRGSSSSDELFDWFQEALKLKITDIGLYKMLLGNPALNSDELKMFSEKIIKQFPQHSFDTLFWTGSIFENQKEDLNRLYDSIKYYQRAFRENPFSEQTLLRLLNLYDYENDIPANNMIIEFIESTMITVNRKSSVYFALSDHYKKTGNIQIAVRYLALGEKAAERESD